MKINILVILSTVFCIGKAGAQQRTPAQQLITYEDSLNNGLNAGKTVISGYGSAAYQRNFDYQTATINLERAVLFVGHQFNSKISFFSELEIENAKVDGRGDAEIAMEQAFLKFNLNSRQYIVAGLFIPRIGILNENHLPVNFNGVERPLVEQFIIPATWRELGVAFYGRSLSLPLNYSIGLMNGLNSANFEHGSGIREGRYEGRNASANNIAISAAVQYQINDLKLQVSGYTGGTNALNNLQSDSLQLSSGLFGIPVYLGEADLQYAHAGFTVKLLGAYISFPDADRINKAYANNVSSSSYGAYAEVAYNLFQSSPKNAHRQLNLFSRYEIFDLNASIPGNAVYDGKEKQQQLITGISFLPIPNIVLKADIRLAHTGPENPALVNNPNPVSLPYKQSNQFLNLGIGYSF